MKRSMDHIVTPVQNAVATFEKHVVKTGAITDPLVVTSDSEILADHSRLRIEKALRDEGDTRIRDRNVVPAALDS
jgi:hypothetical protein